MFKDKMDDEEEFEELEFYPESINGPNYEDFD